MENGLTGIIGQSDMMPHGYCINWTPSLLTLSVISNALIFLAYFSIPIALFVLTRKRKEMGYRRVLVLFALFIMACGTTHLLHIVTYWKPWYWLQAILDAITAVVSVATAIYLWPLIPRLLNTPGHEQLMRLNAKLEHEIENRKAAEENIRAKNLRYETLLRTAGDGIHVIDLDGNVLEANDTFCETLGYTQEEMRGMNVGQLDVHFSSQELKAGIREMVGKSMTIETQHRCRDGSIIEVEVNVAGVDIGGQQMLYCASRDITRRKQAEEELRQAKVFSETLLDSLPGIFFRLDLEGRLLGWNRMLETLLGQEGLEKARSSALNVIHVDDRAAVAAKIGEGFEQGYADVEARLVLKSGNAPWFNFVSRSLAVGDQLYLLGTGTDIAERKLAEDKLLRSNADLEQFAYSVSHDMRAPLRVVSGHLQLLQRGLKDKLGEDDRENLAFALDGAKRMDAMIVSLLEYSRVGRLTDEQKWLPSREPFDEALGFLKPSIEEVRAEIKVEGEWPRVHASLDELTRLFQNLLGNALRYHEPESPPRLEVLSSFTDKLWRVSVRDHGIGIAPEQIGRLFQFFSRLQARSRFEGTGMGLALCRRIVEHHGGRIWVESEGEGKGSTFVFEIPMQHEGEESDAK